jgi:hypothetical protein
MRALVLMSLVATAAHADPLRLRGDALAETRSPAGLIVLEGSDEVLPWLGAEALVWAGGGDGAEAAVLTVLVRARDPGGRGELRLGRQVVVSGAVRPVHLDGLHAIGRAGRFTLELFGGTPVVARRVPAGDWAAGGRFAAKLGPATAGVAYVARNHETSEVGLDAAVLPLPWLDLAGRASWSLLDPGLSEAHVSAAARHKAWRVEAWGRVLSPSRLLPATSLFSVLGDLPSRALGADVRWRAAPRLDLRADLAVRDASGDVGFDGQLAAHLRLDDRGAGVIRLELRRGLGWLGARPARARAARRRARAGHPRRAPRSRRAVAVGARLGHGPSRARLGDRRRRRGLGVARACEPDGRAPACVTELGTVTRTGFLLGAGVLAISACAAVLGLRTRPQPFAHRAHVLKGVSCVNCHSGIAEAADTGPLHLPGQDKCLGCHTDPHDQRSCVGCHSDPHAAAAAVQARAHLKFSHAVHVPVLKGNCARCHVDVAEDNSTLRPRMATCLRCHEARAEGPAFDPRDCDRCHVDLPSEGVLPASHVAHEGDFLREHGARAASSRSLCATCHAQRFCDGCHGATAPAPRARIAFDDPFTPSVHRGGFRARHAEEARGQPGLCTTCHTERSCQSCHADEGVASGGGRAPHPEGWVGALRNDHGPAARRDPVACSSCHGGAGEALCVGCHKVDGIGGSPHAPGWSSTRSMREAPCVMCHSGGGL